MDVEGCQRDQNSLRVGSFGTGGRAKRSRAMGNDLKGPGDRARYLVLK